MTQPTPVNTDPPLPPHVLEALRNARRSGERYMVVVARVDDAGTIHYDRHCGSNWLRDWWIRAYDKFVGDMLVASVPESQV